MARQPPSYQVQWALAWPRNFQKLKSCAMETKKVIDAFKKIVPLEECTQPFDDNWHSYMNIEWKDTGDHVAYRISYVYNEKLHEVNISVVERLELEAKQRMPSGWFFGVSQIFDDVMLSQLFDDGLEDY